MIVSVKGDEYDAIRSQIYELWNEDAMADGANSLEKLYMAGHPQRDEDEYLWKLTKGKKTFTHAEIDELERQVNLIQGDTYPREVKDAVSKLLDLVKKEILPTTMNSKGRNQALRNAYEIRTGQGAAPGQGPANLIRRFAGIEVPKGSEGGKRSRKLRKKRKTRKGRKTHRK